MKAKNFFFVGSLLSAFGRTQPALAETKYLAWDPVTTCADGSRREAGQTVGYKAYWTQDPWLAAETLRPLVSSTTATSAAFDPAAEGIVGYQTVYFTVKTVVGTGTESTFSAALPWDPPPPPPLAYPACLSQNANDLDVRSGGIGDDRRPAGVFCGEGRARHRGGVRAFRRPVLERVEHGAGGGRTRCDGTQR